MGYGAPQIPAARGAPFVRHQRGQARTLTRTSALAYAMGSNTLDSCSAADYFGMAGISLT